MSLAQAARLIEEVAALGVEEFLLTGGEPLAREDLPQIVAILQANNVRWSLNTAAMPGAAAQRAMLRWPPCFVAVSLDGPAEVHDRFRGREGAFREATEAIAFFAQLVPNGVAAGTTVTARNFPHLGATFASVVSSGATSWGLHLVVPEGRAAGRRRLCLSRRQLQELLRFAAAKREWFPVTMADEIGYCGDWEPLVRDLPFFCGAGKAQCVVLPDGEVVPCTTLDRSASAGNVLRAPLREIWQNGFWELRRWTPAGKCRNCEYAITCGGGCWLQRRHGTQCFRSAWQGRRALTKAGLAVCLGLAAAGLSTDRAAVAAEAPPPRPERRALDEKSMEVIQRHIIQWYAAQVGGHRAPTVEQVEESLRAALPDDPAARYVLDFIQGERPSDIAARAKQIEAALKTPQRSLCLVGLAWRDVAEWCLDGKEPGKRSADERAALRRVLTSLATTADAWRKEIFREKLDPFLRRPNDFRRFFASKAGPPPSMRLEQGLAAKRGWTNDAMTDAFLEEHPHAEGMTLSFEATGPGELRTLRAGNQAAADGKLHVFDILIVPQAQGGAPIKLAFDLGQQKLDVTLPSGCELAYADLLRLACEQQKDAVEKLADALLRSARRPPCAPLALPVLRQRLKQLASDGNVGTTAANSRYLLLWRLIDLYLF
jgi:radical SAM protein with 4Fe4S-binding SPASM domain